MQLASNLMCRVFGSASQVPATRSPTGDTLCRHIFPLLDLQVVIFSRCQIYWAYLTFVIFLHSHIFRPENFTQNFVNLRQISVIQYWEVKFRCAEARLLMHLVSTLTLSRPLCRGVLQKLIDILEEKKVGKFRFSRWLDDWGHQHIEETLSGKKDHVCKA